MRTICSLMLTFCKAFFLMRNLLKGPFSKKKGGLKKLVEFSLPRRKKSLHEKKMDGISMIIRVMASRGHQPWDLSDLVRRWDQLRGPDILRSVFWSSARRRAIFLGGIQLKGFEEVTFFFLGGVGGVFPVFTLLGNP